MAHTKERDVRSANTGSEPIPPGATRKAFDREANGGGTPGSPLGDRHAAGTPGGGTGEGGLGGTNIGDGEPDNADLEKLMGSSAEDEGLDEEGPPYGGISGGAVGGTPAEGRSSGGNVAHPFDPGSGTHRGDSTLGSDPNKDTEGA